MLVVGLSSLDENYEQVSIPDEEISIPVSSQSQDLVSIMSYNDENIIPVVIGNRPQSFAKCESRVRMLKTIRRNIKGEISIYLPNIAVYNHRSIWAKINNFAKEFKELKLGIAFNSEIWEKQEDKKHAATIEKLCEMKGLGYFSTPRPNKRGGGSALIVNEKSFAVKHYKPENPDNLEVTFGILRPKAEGGNHIVIILCAVYSPPRSKKKPKLVSFITTIYHQLKNKYQDAFFILGGDMILIFNPF